LHQDPRWRISAIFDFRGPIMGPLKSPCTTSYRSSIHTVALKCLVFQKITILHVEGQDPRWRISAVLDYRGPIMSSLKIQCTASYRSSIETIALNCLVFEKIAFLQFGDRQTDKQTHRQTNGQH